MSTRGRLLSLFSILLLLTPLSTAGPEDEKAAKALRIMNGLLLKKDYDTFYKEHCHQHIKKQMSLAQMKEAMNTEPGTLLAGLFAAAIKALDDQAGKDVLVAQVQEDPDEYEFNLEKRRPSLAPEDLGKPKQMWRIELKKEDGRWKFMDMD